MAMIATTSYIAILQNACHSSSDCGFARLYIFTLTTRQHLLFCTLRLLVSWHLLDAIDNHLLHFRFHFRGSNLPPHHCLQLLRYSYFRARGARAKVKFLLTSLKRSWLMPPITVQPCRETFQWTFACSRKWTLFQTLEHSVCTTLSKSFATFA